jgi:hypothetical protein
MSAPEGFPSHRTPVLPKDLHYELSLALHEAVGRRLDEEVLARARHKTEEWLARGGSARPLLERWRQILDRPLDEIRRWLTDPSEEAAQLRKASPFAGALPPRERERIMREFRQRAGTVK